MLVFYSIFWNFQKCGGNTNSWKNPLNASLWTYPSVMTTTSDSVQQSSSDVEMNKDPSNQEAEMGSGDARATVVNGDISVALVQNVNVPVAEKQTAEHVQLDDDGSKKCCCLMMWWWCLCLISLFSTILTENVNNVMPFMLHQYVDQVVLFDSWCYQTCLHVLEFAYCQYFVLV